MDKSNFTLIFFFTLLLMVQSVIATDMNLTASIGNARMILRPEVIPGYPTVINRTIQVINANPVDVKISVNVSDELKPYVTIIDSSFVLKPEEVRDARFVITLTQPGRYEGNILVTFLPDNNLENVSGVGLASNILILAKQSNETAPPNITIASNGSSAGNGTTDTTPLPTGNGPKLTEIIVILVIFLLIVAGAMFYLKSGKSKNKKGTQK